MVKRIPKSKNNPLLFILSESNPINGIETIIMRFGTDYNHYEYISYFNLSCFKCTKIKPCSNHKRQKVKKAKALVNKENNQA
jgi:hypothetical protein